MAGSSTTYKVDIVYDLKGSAAGGLKNLSRDAKKATADLGGLKSLLAVIGGGMLFHAGKKAFIDFNSEVQRLKIGLATVTAMNFHQPFEAASKAADTMFDHFQKMAITSPNTTKDFVEMANMISSGVLQAGLGLKELETITKGAVTASNALGARPEMLALDVQQMLNGTLSQRDRFARQILAGVGETDYHKFNKYDPNKRVQIVMKAFDSDTLRDASKAFGSSFEGVVSTLKDNLQITLGKVGMPLMKALTAEVSKWNDWILANPDKIESVVNTISSGLSEAFDMAKSFGEEMLPLLKDAMGAIESVASFVSQHRDVLLNVAKGLLIYKGVSMVSGVGMAGVGGIKGIFGDFGKFGDAIKGLRDPAEGVGSSFISLLGTLPGVIGGLAKLGGIAYTVGGLLLGKTKEEKDRENKGAIEFKSANDYRVGLQNLNDAVKDLHRYGFTDEQINAQAGLLSDQKDILGLKDKVKDLKEAQAKYEADLLQKAIAGGYVKEEVDPTSHTRTLYLTPGQSNFSTVKGGTEMINALTELFREKAKEAGPSDSAMFYGPRSFGEWAKFTQELLTKGGTLADLYGGSINPPKPPKIDVNIGKIEVYSDDPDRFVAQAVQSFEEVVKNPIAAHDIMRGAF